LGVPAPPVASGPDGRYAAIVVSDLDGTLLDHGSRLSARNRACLEAMGHAGVLRVVATGRHFESAMRVIDRSFPIDVLAVASGAAIFVWPGARPWISHHLTSAEATEAASVLAEHGLDFMIHGPMAREQRVLAWRTGRPNPDFERRMQRYAGRAEPFTGVLAALPIAGLVAIQRPDQPSLAAVIARALPWLRVVRATSPLDRETPWIELLPKAAGKGQAAEWIRSQLGIDAAHTLAVGNDYNDEDLLAWGARACVTANAPEPLRRRHTVVADHGDDGFCEAASLWLDALVRPGRAV
jgi:hypothetical protein